jgi:hypothetical protein
MFFIENVVIYVHFTIGQGMILAKHCPIGRGMIFLKFENWIFDAKSLNKWREFCPARRHIFFSRLHC